MSRYSYFIAGRWRNHQVIREVAEKIRSTGSSVYCFLENEYDGDGVKFDNDSNADAETMMRSIETLKNWQENPTFNKIFETDMSALKDSDKLVLIFPAGLSAHMELGAAYGLGKKCYGIGEPEKPETLYKMFNKIYPNVDAFLQSEVGALEA